MRLGVNTEVTLLKIPISCSVFGIIVPNSKIKTNCVNSFILDKLVNFVKHRIKVFLFVI